jgi:hypothetical protein
LKRGKPLKRKTWMRSRSKTNSYRKRPRDLDFMMKVRKLPCIVRTWLAILNYNPNDEAEMVGRVSPWILPPNITPCTGRVQADHLGRRALGRKADDDTCAPMCQNHHQERTDYGGIFKGFKAEDMRDWCDWAIRRTKIEVENMR